MKRILLIGNSPLPEENSAVRPAAALRTWQFLKGLERVNGTGAHFQIRLVTIDMPECRDQTATDEIGVLVQREAKNYEHFIVSKNDPEISQKIQNLHDDFHPDVIISVNTYPSYIAAGIKSLAPLWSDLNGWIMAEAQAQAFKMGSNDYLDHYFQMEKRVIEAADKLSAVSKAEAGALLGELGAFGRLNKESFGYKFVEHVPNGTEWLESEKKESELRLAAIENLPKEAFVLLWVGGYNTWVDEFTLFKGVNEAMAQCPNLYFVSTGGQISGLDGQTFEKFRKMIEESEYKNRFVFLGWVETAAMPIAYARAQAGINVDRRCVETLTGARNRINEMMKFGLPVITTRGSEIADEMTRVGAGISVKSGDHVALAAAIAKIYSEWSASSDEFKEYSRKGMKYIEAECNYGVTLTPLIEWLENPRPAPDRGVNVKFGGGAKWAATKARMVWRYLRANGFKKSFQKFLQKVRG